MTVDVATKPQAWVPSIETFGARLALVRQRMGWGNVKLAAEKCSLPAESWRTWERDGIAPRHLTTIAMQIAGATGVDYLWLVHGPGRGGAGGDGSLTLRYPFTDEGPDTRRDALEPRVLTRRNPRSADVAVTARTRPLRPIRRSDVGRPGARVTN